MRLFKPAALCYAVDMKKLDEKRIAAALGLPEVRVEVFDETPSTNDVCRRALAAGAEKCLAVAARQSGGRGRRGRAFFSPPGGLYMSVALPAAPDELGLTCRAAVAAAEAVAAVTGIECGIKWVNDLCYEGKKVCGILCEQAGDHAIVGIGVNLIPAPLPPELEARVGFLDCGDVREPLAAAIARALLLRDPADRGFMEAYRRRSVVLGREVTCVVGTERFPARALEIADDGALVVLGPNGRETLRWGEVSVRGDFMSGE